MLYRNRKNIEQPRDFSGLEFRTAMPTDLDAFLDLRGEAFVFIEAKYRGFDMPRGQRLALERLCDAVEQSGVHAIVIFAVHDDKDPDTHIKLATCEVVEVRTNYKWHRPRHYIEVRRAIDMWLFGKGIVLEQNMLVDG